jgi:hypothetical protein
MADTDRFMFSDGVTNYHEPVFDVGGGLYSTNKLGPATGAQVTVSWEHAEIHEGDHYYLSGSVTLDSAASDFVDFGVVTPNTTEWAHMTFELSSSGQFTFTVYEGMAFASSDGTAIVPFNSNRNSLNTSSLTIVTNPGYTEAASDIIVGPQTFGKDGNVVQVVGGSLSRARELVLKQNTNYIYRIKSSTAANVINYTAEWYEHTNKA